MSKLSCIPRIIALICFVYTLSAAAAPAPTIQSVKFPAFQDGFILVPVTINGAGPFKFLFDTGSNSTVLEPKLAAQLNLPRVGQDVVSGVQADTRVSVVHAESMSMAGATLVNLDLVVCSRRCPLPYDARGILGENFLAKFDFLVDYRHHLLELDSTAGELVNHLEGERLPVRTSGLVEGQHTSGRLIVTGQAIELGKKPLSLLLDSGINFMVLSGGPGRLGAGTLGQDFAIASVSGTSGYASLNTRMIRALRLGSKTVNNVLATAPAKCPAMDTDGLMPLSAFHSVFISHSHSFVILDPSFSKTSRNADGSRGEMNRR
jgi:hypothetical protein